MRRRVPGSALLLPALLLLAGTVACAAAATLPTGAEAAVDDVRHDLVADGVRLAYWTSRPIAPSDVPVVYLHGGPGYNGYSFRMTAGRRLAAHVPMVYLDERGSGASERPWNGDYAMPRMVADVEALRRALRVERMVVMGHSFGGALAADYAAAHPEHVARLILVDAAVDVPEAMASWVGTLAVRYPAIHARLMAGAEGAALREAAQAGDRCRLSRARMAFVGAAQQQMADSQAFHDGQQFHRVEALAEQRRLDAASGLRNTGEIGAYVFGDASDFPCYRVAAPERLSMPTLVVVGRHDRAVGVAPQQALAARLPDARLVVFEESAHFPYAEETDRFVDTVVDFLGAR
ncbi:alpha/beta fold hydrolase [Cognatilysobacter segetis]|uniref:alpha/beta fold hydrolase n=1 Tax=Cognatilysobacter segetis TaxID=2492394 RepID=UPI0010609597|nr:alpha/beta hydrolase [Lysobacter segetis]